MRAIDKVSTGVVTVMASPADPAVYNAEVDATAGGSMKTAKKSVCLSRRIILKKVEISDVQAETNSGWDLALKRWQIKLNSGDSGPGGVKVSRVPGKALGEVTIPPPEPTKRTPISMPSAWMSDWIGGPGTALSDWYDYESGTSRISPKKGSPGAQAA